MSRCSVFSSIPTKNDLIDFQKFKPSKLLFNFNLVTINYKVQLSSTALFSPPYDYFLKINIYFYILNIFYKQNSVYKYVYIILN